MSINFIQSDVFEVLPPTIKNGKQHIIGLTINEKNATLSIFHHTLNEGESDKEIIRNPTDTSKVEFPLECLEWLSQRLDGIRQSKGIKSKWDK